MIKLYKRVQGRLLYHEAWDTNVKVMEHWGAVGERGETREHPLKRGADPEDAVEEVLRKPREDGYEEIDDLKTVLVEYAVNGFGTPEDLAKRHALEERLGETLGWTGLGHCDGGSSGSGTMEACCLVVDADVARRVIEADLKGTEFADYARIHAEDED